MYAQLKKFKDTKKNQLKENIKILEDLYSFFEQAINQLNEIIKNIDKNKEEVKQKIQNIFTKIRNAINEREDKLLLEVDTKFENFLSSQNIIKNNEKLPNKIKKCLEKGKLINDEWSDNNLAQLINECINIEDCIKIINFTKEKIEEYKNNKLDYEFKIDDNIFKSIKNYGSILENKEYIFSFRFKEGTNYTVTNDGKIATRNEKKGLIVLLLEIKKFQQIK